MQSRGSAGGVEKKGVNYVGHLVCFRAECVKFTLGWLDRIDRTVRQHMTQQGMMVMMIRGMATSRIYMSPDDIGMRLKSSVCVYLLELVRVLLQYKLAPSSGASGSGGWS